MATFYIQLEDRLLKISGDLTHDNIVRALGYTPSDFSGNFNDLIDNPLTQDGNGEFKIVDESGNIIAIVDSEGIHSIDFVAGDHKLSEKADKSEIPSLDGYATESWVENKGYAKQEDLDNIDFNTLKNTPFSDDENGELNIVDESGNIIAKIDAEGIHSVDFIAGEHKLSELSNYVTDDELSQKGFLVGEETSEELDDVETNTYVKYVVQTLTDEQKNQVRENLGIPSVDYIISLFEELKTLINNNSASDAIAVLDKAILDMHKLQ